MNNFTLGLFFTLSFFLIGTANAQQLPQFSQYVINDYVINPAIGGSLFRQMVFQRFGSPAAKEQPAVFQQIQKQPEPLSVPLFHHGRLPRGELKHTISRYKITVEMASR